MIVGASGPVVLAGITGAVSVITSGLLYVRSRKADEATEKIAVATESAQGITQAFAGLNHVIAGLKENNEELRQIIATLQAEGRVDEEALARCSARVGELDRELNRMYRKYGNGDA